MGSPAPFVLYPYNKGTYTMPFIVSKCGQSTRYTGWKKGKNGLNQREMSVVIKGGANVVDKKTLTVPNGVITEVTADELAFLKSNSAFKRHVDRGWLTILSNKAAAEKLSEQSEKDEEGFVKKDGSAQLTKEDFERAGKTPPKVGGEE